MKNIATEKSHLKHFENKLKEVDDAVKKAETELNNMKKTVEVWLQSENEFVI